MFEKAYRFNQPLNNWVFTNAYAMDTMFNDATDFNQDIS